MTNKLRKKIISDIRKTKEIRGYIKELGNGVGWQLKDEQEKLDKKIEFFKNLEKELNKE